MRFQGKFPAKHTGWLRLLLRGCAFVCVGIVLLAASTQACHFHAPGTQSGPDHCPICIALHPAMPAASHAVQTITRAISESIAAAPLHRYHHVWSFDLSIRPPPALSA
jgi:hypothetical protein